MILSDLENRLAGIESRTKQATDELGRLESRLAALTGTNGAAKNGTPMKAAKPRKKVSRKGKDGGDPLWKILQGVFATSPEGLTIGEATKLAISSGWKTASANPQTLVSQVLKKRSDLFKQIGSGKTVFYKGA